MIKHFLIIVPTESHRICALNNRFNNWMPINRLVFRRLSNQICRCQHRCRPNSIRKRRDAFAQTVANFHTRRSSSCRIRREGWFLCGRFSFINKKKWRIRNRRKASSTRDHLNLENGNRSGCSCGTRRPNSFWGVPGAVGVSTLKIFSLCIQHLP